MNVVSGVSEPCWDLLGRLALEDGLADGPCRDGDSPIRSLGFRPCNTGIGSAEVNADYDLALGNRKFLKIHDERTEQALG